ACARDRAKGAAARRGHGRIDAARGAARDRSGARYPSLRHHACDRRTHHGSHHVAGKPRRGVSPRQGNRPRLAARGDRQPGRDRGLSRHPRGQGRRRPHADRTDGRARVMTGPLLKIEHLEVRYGDLIGVSDVSLEVPEGSVVALLGSNGGGKTTTLNAIAGLIPVHSGSISFRGEEIGGQSAFAIVRKGLALSPEGWRLFVQQSVENNLKLGATPLRDKTRTAR